MAALNSLDKLKSWFNGNGFPYWYLYQGPKPITTQMIATNLDSDDMTVSFNRLITNLSYFGNVGTYTIVAKKTPKSQDSSNFSVKATLQLGAITTTGTTPGITGVPGAAMAGAGLFGMLGQVKLLKELFNPPELAAQQQQINNLQIELIKEKYKNKEQGTDPILGAIVEVAKAHAGVPTTSVGIQGANQEIPADEGAGAEDQQEGLDFNKLVNAGIMIYPHIKNIDDLFLKLAYKVQANPEGMKKLLNQFI